MDPRFFPVDLLPRHFQPHSKALSSLPPLVIGRKTLVAAGHVTTCATNFSTGVQSMNNLSISTETKESQSLVIAMPNHTRANTPLKFSSLVLYFHISSVLKYHSDFNSSRSSYLELMKLFCGFMLAELTSQHIAHYIKQCFIYHNKPCLYICLKINLHRPDVNERLVQAYVNKTVNHFTLPRIKCKSEYLANRPCDRNIF